ncbi:MAG: trigger factor [Muribaculaceae bacterium]|nr:trigger factor [Muribaculaceae bacterium]
MNVTFDKIDDVTGKINISIAESDYSKKVDQELKKIGQTHKIDGFRPGHVPVGVLKKMFGKHVLVEVINREVYDALFNYIEKEKLNVLGEPLADNAKELDFDNDKDFDFTFELGFAPNIDVTVDKSLKVPFYNINVDNEMLEKQDDAFRTRFGKQVPGEEVDATALVKGSMVELNDDSTAKEDGVKVEKTIVSPQHFTSDEQKNLFVGKKVGDKIVFNPYESCNGNITELASMLNIDKDKAEIKSNFEMEISEIIVLKKAEHNEEFYKDVFGIDTIKSEEEYNEKLTEFIAAQLINDSNYRFTIDLKDALMNQVGEVKLPTEFLRKWLLKKDSKYTEDNIDNELAQMIEPLKWQLIKENALKKLGVKVEEADVNNMAKELARAQFAQYGMTNIPDDTVNHYAKDMLANEQYRRSIVDRTVEEKFYAAVKEAINLETKNVSTQEFNALFEK